VPLDLAGELVRDQMNRVHQVRGLFPGPERDPLEVECGLRDLPVGIRRIALDQQLYLQLRAELPYASAVETEKYEERRDGSVAIHQQILVARDTQRAIILGHRGARLKEIGQKAREELSRITGQKVHLFLHVKVNPRWEEDRDLYRDIGLDWVD